MSIDRDVIEAVREMDEHELRRLFMLARARLEQQGHSFPELLDEGHEPHAVPRLWLMAGTEANLHVDITDTIDRKIEALIAHHSQNAGRAEGLPVMIREWAKANADAAGLVGRAVESYIHVALERHAGEVIDVDEHPLVHKGVQEELALGRKPFGVAGGFPRDSAVLSSPSPTSTHRHAPLRDRLPQCRRDPCSEIPFVVLPNEWSPTWHFSPTRAFP